MRGRAVLASVIFATGATGCTSCRRFAGEDTVRLEKSEVRSMSVDIRREQKTICPREPVQMAVFMDVALDGDKTVRSFETWAGRGAVNKNDKLDFADFAFSSAEGTFDAFGWFTPNPDVIFTAGRELEITTAYRRRPDRFTFKTSYKPSYGCIRDTGQDGGPGSPGAGGGSGGPGGNGSDGQNGPRYTLFATLVKTPFYDRVVALAVTGDAEDILLVPEDQPFVVHARGGDGGPGGAGGRGMQGQAGASGNPGQRGGDGGRGGSGGHGGHGGNGGTVELVYDARFPDLRSQITMDVTAGAGGRGGAGGQGGPGGPGGTGLTPPPSKPGEYVPSAPSGSPGSTGAAGSTGGRGHDGQPGRATYTAGRAKERFSRWPELQPL